MTKAIVGVLVALLAIPTPIFAQPKGGLESSQQTIDVWDRVQGLPPGTLVRLVLSDGSKRTGTVTRTSAEAVVLTIDGATTASPVIRRTAIRRADLTAVDIIKMARRYKAENSLDSSAVGQVVAELGLGRKVDVRTASERVRGRISAINAQSFVVTHGSRSISQSFIYGDVREIKAAGMPWGAKTAIIAAAAYAVWGLYFLNQI